jgi:hypothetical protein
MDVNMEYILADFLTSDERSIRHFEFVELSQTTSNQESIQTDMLENTATMSGSKNDLKERLQFSLQLQVNIDPQGSPHQVISSHLEKAEA